MSLAGLTLPILRRLPAEMAHRLTVRALAAGLAGGRDDPPDASLRQRVFGLTFENPIGLAAGFDKDAEAPSAALRLGFGFVEIGTVTPRPQPGNPRPRLFRLPAERAVVNRMGFNNAGAEAAARRLAALPKERRQGLIGVNIGKNKDSEDAAADYAACTRILAPHADYLVINVSSPNTPGLRALQSPDSLRRLIAATRAAATKAGSEPPLLVKIAPDLTGPDLAALAEVARAEALAGLIVSNTTIGRPEGLRGAAAQEPGGLSGAPLFRASTEVLAEVYRLTDGRIPLVGVGGIASAADAYAKIRAGASLVQLYTALVYEGPDLIGRLIRDLPVLLKADGFATLAEAVGADHR